LNKQNIDGVVFFFVPFRGHTIPLTQILSVFPQNYNIRPRLMNMAFRPRHLQPEISVCSEIPEKENYKVLHLSVVSQ